MLKTNFIRGLRIKAPQSQIPERSRGTESLNDFRAESRDLIRIKTFGLDRIVKLELQELSVLKKEDYTTQLDKFQKVIGLDYDAAEKPETIEQLKLQVDEQIAIKPHFLQVAAPRLKNYRIPHQRLDANVHHEAQAQVVMHLLFPRLLEGREWIWTFPSVHPRVGRR